MIEFPFFTWTAVLFSVGEFAFRAAPFFSLPSAEFKLHALPRLSLHLAANVNCQKKAVEVGIQPHKLSGSSLPSRCEESSSGLLGPGALLSLPI
jgi:hypothetical protein